MIGSFTPQLLYFQGKSPLYPLDNSLGGPQSHPGHSGGKEERFQPLLAIEPYAFCSLITILTELP